MLWVLLDLGIAGGTTDCASIRASPYVGIPTELAQVALRADRGPAPPRTTFLQGEWAVGHWVHVRRNSVGELLSTE
jgi:hypothetical protein